MSRVRVIWCVAASQRAPISMLVLLLNNGQVKIVSDVIKGLGVLQVPGGNLLVELNTLRGRGIAVVDDVVRFSLLPKSLLCLLLNLWGSEHRRFTNDEACGWAHNL